jgi:integrase
LGRRRLSEIDRIELQDFVDELVGNGASAALIEATISPIRSIYRRALSRGEITVNPTTGLELPATNNRRDRIAPPAECMSLLAALPRKEDRALWATAMFAGLRRGELQALRIEDIDLGAGVINVCRGWDRHEGEITPKSGKARKVPISGRLRDFLDEHLLGLAWQEGLVFGVSAVSPLPPKSISSRADRAWEKANLNRITLHECRHSYASIMIAAGVNAKALSEYMGHSNISITLDLYGHLMPGNEEEAAGLLDAYLERTDSRARIAQAST